MDFQEMASPSTREKVDIAQPIRDKEESSKWNHRRSLAWDSAFSTTPGVLDHEELFGILKLAENEIDVIHKDTIKTLPTEIAAARPSFAWDNAFFTEPGVLDAEELSLVNDGFITSSNTQRQPRNSDDSMTTTTTQEGSRFSVSSIEFDLFNHLRASLSNSSKVNGAQDQIQRNLPDGKKRTKWYKLKGSQPLSLIPQPKVYPPSSSIPKSLTPCQAKPEKKIVASELGRKKGKHKDNGFEEKYGSQSIVSSSYSGYTMKDLTSSSSGLRLPLPKMGFFDSEENGEKENRNPNSANRRHKSPLETTYSLPDNRNVLGQRKKRK